MKKHRPQKRRKRPRFIKAKAQVGQTRPPTSEERAAFDMMQAAGGNPVVARLISLERTVTALVEAVGPDEVRRANARIGSTRSLSALATHVANGKLTEVDVVTPEAVVAELKETSADDGSVLTPSLVADLGAIDPEHAKKLRLLRVGERVLLGSAIVTVLRAWEPKRLDAAAPVPPLAPAPEASP